MIRRIARAALIVLFLALGILLIPISAYMAHAIPIGGLLAFTVPASFFAFAAASFDWRAR